MQASLTWRMRQGQVWRTTSLVMPAESAARVASSLLWEFAQRPLTPADVSVLGDVKRFNFRTSEMTLSLRRLEKS